MNLEPTPIKKSRSPFSEELPELQLAWDSTSLALLQECPKKYWYVMIQKWAVSMMAIDLSFGIAFHSALEEFQYALLAGIAYEEAVLRGVQNALSWDDTPYTEHPNYPYKNRHTLARTFVWHTEHYRNDAFKIIEVQNHETGKVAPGVELSFTIDLGVEGPDGPFLLCGHLDAVGTFQDDYWFMDHKTTKRALDQRYFAGFNPSTQMTNYFFAAQVILDQPARGGIINAAQLLVNGTRFGRHFIHRTPDQMVEWERNLHFQLSLAQRFAEEQFWPMNTNSCDNYGGCPFRSICSKDPSVRDAFLAAEFVKREWNPLETRGDL